MVSLQQDMEHLGDFRISYSYEDNSHRSHMFVSLRADD